MTNPINPPITIHTYVPPMPPSSGVVIPNKGTYFTADETITEEGLEKTCSNCIFFESRLDKEWQNDVLGGEVDFDICTKLSRAISNSNSAKTNKIYQKKIASTCSEFKSYTDFMRPDNELNMDDVKLTDSKVYVGIPTFNRSVLSDKESPKPKKCSVCVFNRPAEVLRGEDLNIETTLNICAAKGFVNIIGNDNAKDCSIGVPIFAPNVPDEDYLKFLKEYENSIKGSLEPLEDLTPMDDFVNTTSIDENDPLDYKSDKDVTDEDKSFGIISWRRIENVEGDKHIFMPIFDPNKFSDEERSKIPRPGDQEHPELYVDYNHIMYKLGALWTMGETPNLIGYAGTGKSEAYRHAAYLMQLPFERISVTNSTEIDDLAGHAQFSKEKGTYFNYGRIPKTWAKPCVVLIDEPNVGPPDVWQFIRPLTDNSKQLVLDINNGERISRHKHCFMGMAMNPAWDSRNVGTHEISDADGRRLMHIFVPMPNAAVEQEIVLKHCATNGYKIEKSTYRQLEKICKDIRELCSNDVLPIQWGVAQQIKVARATEFFTVPESYNLAIADLIDPDSAEAIRGVVASHKRGVIK